MPCVTKWAVYTNLAALIHFDSLSVSLFPWAINARRQKAPVRCLWVRRTIAPWKKAQGREISSLIIWLSGWPQWVTRRKRQNTRAPAGHQGLKYTYMYIYNIYTHDAYRQVRCRACHAALAQQTLMQNKPLSQPSRRQHGVHFALQSRLQLGPLSCPNKLSPHKLKSWLFCFWLKFAHLPQAENFDKWLRQYSKIHVF